jgi:NADP-dependent 3-hydroxy acid dehydrogenase YdfG
VRPVPVDIYLPGCPGSAQKGAVVTSIVVTGASSGIGRATALLLAERGHQVFATVRKKADAQS